VFTLPVPYGELLFIIPLLLIQSLVAFECVRKALDRDKLHVVTRHSSNEESVMVDRNMHLGQSELCNNSINNNDILITRF